MNLLAPPIEDGPSDGLGMLHERLAIALAESQEIRRELAASIRYLRETLERHKVAVRRFADQ